MTLTDILLTTVVLSGTATFIFNVVDTIRLRKHSNRIQSQLDATRTLHNKIDRKIKHALELVAFIQSEYKEKGVIDNYYLNTLREEETEIENLIAEFQRVVQLK